MKRFLYKVIYFLFAVFNNKTVAAAAEEIDVVIPVISKDLPVLPLCLEGVRACVQHPIKNIYIIAPPEKEIQDFCAARGLVYAEEKNVTGITPEELRLPVPCDGKVIDRSGWLLQQLAKLSGAVGTCRNYLCIDADHVLLQPHTFISRDGTPVFYMSHEYHRPYYDMLAKLTGLTKTSPLSYVAHKMIINREQLASLHRCIHSRTHKPWRKAIVDLYDRTQVSGFSEYETYGCFVKDKIKLPWAQRTSRYSDLADYDSLVKRFGKRYKAVTFPEYYNH
ncbi:MAG: DUF6492 family protein [Prevotellaceae bacterium]|jgi:hypothetical protein|nr:DUF6492 family protein [Prevotellaceae bacterium]